MSLECPKCGSIRLQELHLACNPPQYEYFCPKCGWGLRYFDREDPFAKLTEKERKEVK